MNDPLDHKAAIKEICAQKDAAYELAAEMTDILEGLVSWNDKGHIDETWWTAAREVIGRNALENTRKRMDCLIEFFVTVEGVMERTKEMVDGPDLDYKLAFRDVLLIESGIGEYRRLKAEQMIGETEQ